MNNILQSGRPDDACLLKEEAESWVQTMNRLGASRTPFLFIIDYEMREPVVQPLLEVDPVRIMYDAGGMRNYPQARADARGLMLECRPVPYARYLESFCRVQKHLRDGDSYLVNLTCRTPVLTDRGLRDIFLGSTALFRLFFDDRFVVFSPERFVRIENDRICTYPMKGTIDASAHGAMETLLADGKELAEHLTIVDLLRNDLSLVSRRVSVARFRYVTRVETRRGPILQTSSEIRGELQVNWERRIGDIIASLLPAGSVTGAPKKKTVEIIRAVEDYSRGFYTGVFGIFDGTRLDSGVMIRFIERDGDSFFYKSGGGITVYSDPEAEYREMVQKIYVPIA